MAVEVPLTLVIEDGCSVPTVTMLVLLTVIGAILDNSNGVCTLVVTPVIPAINWCGCEYCTVVLTPFKPPV